MRASCSHQFVAYVLFLIYFVAQNIAFGPNFYHSSAVHLLLGRTQRNLTSDCINNDRRIGTSRRSGKNVVAITFINGIYHSVEDWKRIAEQLQRTFGVDVHPFYNPSSGWWIKDLSKAGFDLVLRPSDLILAKGLADHLRNVLDLLDPSVGRILHLAHSGGAILTYLAAKHHLTRVELSRIDICTLGGGKSITHKYFKGRVRNYYARNDPLTLVDKRASTLLRRTVNGTMVEVQDPKHNTTFVFLEPLEGNPIVDHSMEGLTYKVALEYEANELKIRMKELESLVAKERRIIRKLRKISANITGLHHFFDQTLPSSAILAGRRVRKSFASATGMRGFFSRKYAGNDGNVSMINEGEIIDKSKMDDSETVKLLYDTTNAEEFVSTSKDEILYSMSR